MAYDLLTGKKSPRNWALGAPLTTSTDDVEERLRSLTVDTNNLNQDISFWFRQHASESQAKRFADAWSRWRDETYAFIRSWKEGSFKLKLAWNYVDRAEERMRELTEWRKRWESISHEQATAPASIAPPPPSKKNESGGIWKWAAMGLVGAIGGVILFKKIGA